MPASDWPVEVDPVFGCWMWTGRLDKAGYGRTKSGKLAYHEVYEAEVGPVPEGLQLDHGCRRRACVFAGVHVEPVTKRENERRKRWAYRIRRKTCPKGHNLYLNGRRTEYGGIICRICSGV